MLATGAPAHPNPKPKLFLLSPSSLQSTEDKQNRGNPPQSSDHTAPQLAHLRVVSNRDRKSESVMWRRTSAAVTLLASLVSVDSALHSSPLLTKEDIIDFLHDGHVRIRNMAPELRDPAVVASIQAARVESSKAYHLFAMKQYECPQVFFDMLDQGVPGEEAMNRCKKYYQALGKNDHASFFQLINIHNFSQPFYDIATHPRLGAIASDLLQAERIRLYQTTSFRKVPSMDVTDTLLYNAATHMHADNTQAPVDTNGYFSFWCPLRNLTDADSVLVYVSGSHSDVGKYVSTSKGRALKPIPDAADVMITIDKDQDSCISKAESDEHYRFTNRAVDVGFFEHFDTDHDGLHCMAELQHSLNETQKYPEAGYFYDAAGDEDEEADADADADDEEPIDHDEKNAATIDESLPLGNDPDSHRIREEYKQFFKEFDGTGALDFVFYDEINVGDCLAHHGWTLHGASSQRMEGGPREAIQMSYIDGDATKEVANKDYYTSVDASHEYRFEKWFDDIKAGGELDHWALPLVWPQGESETSEAVITEDGEAEISKE